MLKSLPYGYWLTLLLAIPTAGFLIRLFIIQHDCGHGSFFLSQAANNTLGSILGVVTLTPYAYWQRTHAIHHATAGDLERRGYGDVYTLTVKEYLRLPPHKRIAYRCYRSPLILLGLGPAFQFFLKHRFPLDPPRSWKREWASVHQTNLAILTILLVMWQTVGWERFLLVQLPVFLLAGAIGVWLFYVQHQFEDTYWQNRSSWDYYTAGLEGSSYYALPKILQWFTGNIGLHHIHHMSSLIPNYRLQECLDENPEFRQVKQLTLGESLKCFSLALWDEEQRKLIRFRDLRLSRSAGVSPQACPERSRPSSSSVPRPRD
jgi:omega-6 fatty acid desaturase (delta-12 desaturase)